MEKYDIFAAPVALKFNGQSHFKTKLGGLLSLIYVATSFFITLVLLKALFL
jgi:hypothetical protein